MRANQLKEHSSELGPKQAAHWLGVSVRTLEDWRARGKGPPYFKVGGGVRYSVRELETWLEACRVVPERPYGPKLLTGRACRPPFLNSGPS
jgi:excisionase family DNA binding protein